MRRLRFTEAMVVGVVMVGISSGILYFHNLVVEKRLRKLFAGPCEVVKTHERRYWPRCVYDLRAYLGWAEQYPIEVEEVPLPLSSPALRELRWVDGATPEQFEAMLREMRISAVTGATPREDILRWRSVYRERVPSHLLRISYPPDGAVFPPNFCEPCVEWEDDLDDLWQVTVGVSGTSSRWSFVTKRKRWWFPPKVWRTICKEALNGGAWIQVKGVRKEAPGRIWASEVVHFEVSRDSVDNFIVYRLVSPQFQALKTPDTFIRDVRSFDVTPFLRARERYCFSCHTFSSKEGTEGMMSIKARFTAGRTKPSGMGILNMATGKGWKVTFPLPHKGFTFMAWNSKGDKLAVSANQSFASSTPVIHETQELEYTSSDIAIYDLPRGRVSLLPGASLPDYIEIYPAWTPDDRRIVFSRVRAGVSARVMKFDIYVVDYNDGRGGTPVPIKGASDNGKSNYYARFSPDGRWMSFCMADQGSLVESSSDIYLLPGDLEGPVRRLECNAEEAMDSWHSWSSNGRWLAFASKRDDGIYARIYLTHIDEEGHASPAVRLPVKEPPLKSFNLPEFLANRPRFKEGELFEVVRAERKAVTVGEGGSGLTGRE